MKRPVLMVSLLVHQPILVTWQVYCKISWKRLTFPKVGLVASLLLLLHLEAVGRYKDLRALKVSAVR